jgi:hypothetical protein
VAALPATPFHGRTLICGEWCDAGDGKRITRTSPAHGVAVASYPAAQITRFRPLGAKPGK